jgi:hypothetical protein
MSTAEERKKAALAFWQSKDATKTNGTPAPTAAPAKTTPTTLNPKQSARVQSAPPSSLSLNQALPGRNAGTFVNPNVSRQVVVYIRSTGANRNNDEPTVSVVYTSEAAAVPSPRESPQVDRRDPRRDSSVFKPVDIKKARMEFQKAAEEQAARNFSSVAPKQAGSSTHLLKTTSRGITISVANGTNGTHAHQTNTAPHVSVSPPVSPRTAVSPSQSSSGTNSPRSATTSPREPLTPTSDHGASPDTVTDVKKPKPLPKPPQKKPEADVHASQPEHTLAPPVHEQPPMNRMASDSQLPKSSRNSDSLTKKDKEKLKEKLSGGKKLKGSRKSKGLSSSSKDELELSDSSSAASAPPVSPKEEKQKEKKSKRKDKEKFKTLPPKISSSTTKRGAFSGDEFDFIGKAVSSQSLDAKQPQPEVASSPETTPAGPQTDQPKLRKWFRHKEQLSGGGPSRNSTGVSTDDIEKALQTSSVTKQRLDGQSESSSRRTSRALTDSTKEEDETNLEDQSTSELKERIKTDNNLIKEIILTEKDYVYDLSVIIEIFLQPLRSKEILSAESLDKMFANIEDLYKVHKKLLGMFEKVLDKPTHLNIAKCFVDMAQDLEVYLEFCSKQDSVNQNIKELRATNNDLDIFLEYCYLRRECRNLDINALLIKPIQRICKYPLLLSELEKQSRDTPDHPVTVNAYNLIQSLVGKSNKKRGDRENLMRVQEIENQLRKSNKDDLSLIKEGRYLVSEGELFRFNEASRNKSRGYYFLFNDLFLYTKTKIQTNKERKLVLKYQIGLDEVVLHKTFEEEPYAFELEYGSDMFSHVACVFCTKHETDKETLVNLLEENINKTLMISYLRFLEISPQLADQVTFDQWKKKRLAAFRKKARETQQLISLNCELGTRRQSIMIERNQFNLLSISKLVEMYFGEEGKTILLHYRDQATGERVPIYTQDGLNKAATNSESSSAIDLVLISVEN